MNICPQSYRIWGVGPNRVRLVNILQNICRAQNLHQINFDNINHQDFRFPSWFEVDKLDQGLGHPVSFLNDFLNKNLLTKFDKKGDFDIVYFAPFEMLIIDSKQISHKPMYGELGLSVDIVYNKKEQILQ